MEYVLTGISAKQNEVTRRKKRTNPNRARILNPPEIHIILRKQPSKTSRFSLGGPQKPTVCRTVIPQKTRERAAKQLSTEISFADWKSALPLSKRPALDKEGSKEWLEKFFAGKTTF